MNAMKPWLVAATLATGTLLAACTPMHVKPMPVVTGGHQGTVTVFREPGFFGSGGALIFGADGNDYLSLYTHEYATLTLPPNNYNFYVRTIGADRPYYQPVLVNDNQSVCLRAYVNPTDYFKLFFAIAYYLDSDFKLETIPCPSAEAMKAYRKAGSEDVPEAPQAASN